MTPVHAFLLLVLGVLAVYWELVRPGRVAPGLAGCVLTVAAAYFLWRNAPARVGIGFIGLAVVLFAAEAFWSVALVAGIAASVALTFGFCLLFPAARRIPPALAIPAGVILGGITLILTYSAKRARRNKWADLQGKK